MDAARWEQVRTLFHELFECEAGARTARLEAACGGDAELRATVERLLLAHDRAAGFLEGQPPPALQTLLPLAALAEAGPTTPPVRIGPYRIVREIGRGGMGTVYLAERDEPGLQKTVAVKVVRPGMHSEFVLRRFRTERQILAGLEHPGIARLYDGGTTEEGLPYFVMEYVDGQNLLAFCDAQRLSIEERIPLFRRVCEAVQFAHQRLVVHRDLKPSNILVTKGGEPKLLDFGIAKLLGPHLPGEAAETATVVRLLSPQYASPEQVRGEPITTASDVYSLGVILYELLCGHPPYRVRSRSAADVERAVCEVEPEAPSAMVGRTEAAETAVARITPAEVSARRAALPRKLQAKLRGDLDNVVLTALRKSPAERYATTVELAEDLRRYLEGFPVRARPDRSLYRAAKFVRRHRAGVAAAAVAVLSLVAGSGVALWQAQVAKRERDRATYSFGEVRRLAQIFLFDVHDRIRDLPGATPARELLAKTGLEYLDRVAAHAGDDPSLLGELAGGYERLGDVQAGLLVANLGQSQAGLRSYEKSLELRNRLVDARPHDGPARRELARGQLKMAQTLVRVARVRDAPAWSARAIENLDRCAPSFPGVADFRREHGDALTAHGYYTCAADDLEGGIQSIRRAVAILEPLHAAQPTDPITGRSYAMALFRLNQGLEELPDRRGMDEAVDVAARAVVLNRSLLAAHSSQASIRRGLETALGRVGTLRAVQGRYEDALPFLAEAGALVEADVRADPSDVLSKRNAAVVRHRTARCLVALGRAAEARAMVEPAVKSLEALLADDRDNLVVKVTLAEAQLWLGEARCRLAEGPAARKALQGAITLLEPLVASKTIMGSDAALLGQARSTLAACDHLASTARVSLRR